MLSLKEKIQDKLCRNFEIYKKAYLEGQVMGFGYTWLLWKNHTKFLLRLRNPKSRQQEIQRVVDFMNREFADYVLKYENEPIYDYDISQDLSWKNAKIWIYWNNPDSMPLMVKSCVDRIREMSNGHEVIVITDKTLPDYVKFDPIVWKKYLDGQITRTHLSDFIRVALLYKYGGVYLDSTVYPLRPLSDKFFCLEFFSNHTNPIPDSYQIAHSRWSSFMCGCRKGNLMMKAALDVFTEYWKRYDRLMDYVLIDYTYNLLYDHIPSIKSMIDHIPNNNPRIWSLQTRLADTCSEEEFEAYMSDMDEDVYKLSYKDSIGLPLRDVDGNLTLLGRFCGEK